MSFVEEEGVIEVTETVLAAVFREAGIEVAAPPWPRITHEESLNRFGNDRPDTRFGLELRNVGEALASTEFKVFAGALSSGGVVWGINAGSTEVPRSELDALTETAKRHGAGGLVWAFVEEGAGWRSPVGKFLTDEERSGVIAALDAGGLQQVGRAFLSSDAAAVGDAADLRLQRMVEREALRWMLDMPQRLRWWGPISSSARHPPAPDGSGSSTGAGWSCFPLTAHPAAVAPILAAAEAVRPGLRLAMAAW
jgi:aspartyl-tRNA synthetase